MNAAPYRGLTPTFEALETAATTHEPNLWGVVTGHILDGLHDDPRWLPFLRKLGFAPEQLAAIPFDVKLPK